MNQQGGSAPAPRRGTFLGGVRRAGWNREGTGLGQPRKPDPAPTLAETEGLRLGWPDHCYSKQEPSVRAQMRRKGDNMG